LRAKNTGAVAVLHREEVAPKIAKLLTRFPEVVFAALFGSLATRGLSGHDIDIAVKVEGRDKYTSLARLFQELSDVLGVREEAIDIVDLDRADTMQR
jgi:predicted nucleotidyltransferase